MDTDPEQTDAESIAADIAGIDDDSTAAFRPIRRPDAGDDAMRVEGSFKYALVVEGGPQTGLTYVLGDGETPAGRAPESDVFLADVTVSRHHAVFKVDADGLTVTDLGSTNGTYVNGRRHETAALAPGDEVMLGKFHLVVVVGNV
ncbi:MAG: FHA domain-containing protein [Acidimicrobiia bacterium]|nr:FHA domain-containing protein [Acidimicrobiia bacterium]